MQVYESVDNQLNSQHRQKYARQFLQDQDAFVGQVFVEMVRDHQHTEVNGRNNQLLLLPSSLPLTTTIVRISYRQKGYFTRKWPTKEAIVVLPFTVTILF